MEFAIFDLVLKLLALKRPLQNTRRYPRQFTYPGIKVFGQKNTSIFFIKPSKVSKIYVFQKFYRWDKPLNDLLTNYRLSKVEHARRQSEYMPT